MLLYLGERQETTMFFYYYLTDMSSVNSLKKRNSYRLTTDKYILSFLTLNVDFVVIVNI